MSAFPRPLQALLSPRAYPHPVGTVEFIETHVSWILLTGEFAYKIKRPVQHSFVDQRSLERRWFLCHEEVRLNRRFAPELYLGVCPVAVRAGEVRIEGSGSIIEYAVKMRRFPRTDELDHLLEAKQIEPPELEAFGGELARIHAQLPVAQAAEDWGRPEALDALMLRNIEESASAGKALGGIAGLPWLQGSLEAAAQATAPLRSQRRSDGRVRECHGDLHARNIVRSGTRLLPFDCLEFDPALRWIDVADEIAFLAVDLEARRRPVHALAFLNGYLTESGDYQACAVLPLFKTHRTLVRAKITALAATDTRTDSAKLNAACREYQAYVETARRALAPKRPALVLMCGLSGSGKTWIAQRLSPALSAVHVRSDIERKRLAGLSALDHSESPVGEGLYASASTRAVYDRIAQCAADTMAGGFTTILDATFGRSEERTRMRDVAARLGVTACVVYCRAPRQVLEARIVERQRRQRDPSEADLAVLAWQEGHFEPPEPDEAWTVLEAQSPDLTAIDTLTTRITGLTA